MTPSELFESVILVAPSFRSARDAHIEYHGDLLAHVLMGDLVRFIGTAFGHEGLEGVASPNQIEVRRILDILEIGALGEDQHTRCVISDSFVDNLDKYPFIRDLEPLLGPALTEVLREVRNWDRPH